MTTDTTHTKNRLAFGYNAGLPDSATCAWGARWIVTQDGGVGQLFDRQDMFGSREEKDALVTWLDLGGAGKKSREALSQMLRSYAVSTRESREVVLYEDEYGIVLGNTNASACYFYVVARLREAR